MNPDWRSRFAAKVVSAEEAIRRIPAGTRLLVGSGAGEPASLVRALVSAGAHLSGNELVHLLTLGEAPYVLPEHAGRFRHTAFFIGPNVREAIREGRADFMPVFLSEIPELIRSRRVRVDVALIQVSPPDARGFVSLGVSVDIVRAAVESARLVIAEVNDQMPWTHGDSFVEADRIDAWVRVSRKLPEIAHEPPDAVMTEIGRQIARLIPDGATLQLGIGKIPDAVLAQLSGHHDLGVHTEMFSDGVMHLCEAGVITGRKKTLLPGKLVTSFVMGSEKLYRWVDHHPAVEMRSSDFTNDPATIARNDRMIAINAALAVDLTGQVASDTVGGQFFSGIGGQVDFIRGASKSRGGKPIIALPSMAKHGTVSRIAATLEPGAGVVTSRGDVHYVVTEYGIADLWGKSVRERAEALIAIAHPDVRAELRAEAVHRKWMLPGAGPSPAVAAYAQPSSARLADGRTVSLRPATPGDRAGILALLGGCGDRDVRARFLGADPAREEEALAHWIDFGRAESLALLALSDDGAPVAVARYDVDPATRLAVPSFLVRSDFRGTGLGTALMQRLADIAKARGLGGFTALVPVENHTMLSIFHKSGLQTWSRRVDGNYRLELRFDDGVLPR